MILLSHTDVNYLFLYSQKEQKQEINEKNQKINEKDQEINEKYEEINKLYSSVGTGAAGEVAAKLRRKQVTSRTSV